jgi:low temperature requirement protein LtrA
MSTRHKSTTVPRSRPWWPRAELRRDEDFHLERKVSWLELFFDLVFVVVLARLAHDLAHHPDVDHVVDFALLFAAVFWAWNAFTYYIERFESGGVEQRCFVFAAMACVAALAVWTEGGLGNHYTGFAQAYIAVRTVNMIQWIRAGVHVPEFRPVAVRFVAGFGVTATLLVVAMRTDGDARRLVFACAILVDILTPVFTLTRQAALPQLSTSKFPERFGLFTIVVLGESVVGAITAMSELNETTGLGGRQLLDGALGLCVGIGLWWIYFDFVARRPPKPVLAAVLGWVYLHLVTLAAITATGAAISLVAAETIEGPAPEGRKLLTGAAAVALLGLAALELTLRRDDGEPTHPTISPCTKAVAAVVIFTLGWLEVGWSSTTLLVAIVAALAVPVLYGTTVWYSPNNVHRTLTRGEAS